jgi:putative DNA polymerase III subunit alpha
LANEVFDLLLYFAGYGFNKSHSAAYAYIAYQTAYLKAHYFPEFMAATMTSFMGNMDKMTNYINVCKAKQVDVLGPDINHSERMFTVQDGQIRFGLGGIKHVGDNAIEELLAERRRNGQFASIVDFCERISYRVVNKRLLESLIRCGAMDSFKENRNQLLQIYEQAQGIGAKEQKSSALGAVSLFADVEEMETIHVPDLPDLSKELKLKDEKEYTGFYITGHPLDAYREELQDAFALGRLSENPESFDGKAVTVGGLIVDKVDRITKARQEKMCTLTLEDFTGTVNVVVFPQTYQMAHMLLQRDGVVAIDGRIDADEKGVQLIASSVKPLKVDYDQVRQVRIRIAPRYDTPEASQQLQTLLKELPGQTPVVLLLEKQKRTLTVNPSFYFTPSKESIGRIQALLGANAVELL